MEKRFEGYIATNGFYVLDTFTGEVRFISNGSANQELLESKTIEDDNKPINSNKTQFSVFETEVITSYPYLIAKPFYDLAKETDPRIKCKLMVDTFTAVLKYMALQLASEYLRDPKLKNVQIHQTLVKDLSRPLISAWNLLIARSLKVFEESNVKLFSPELARAYATLESNCKDPFLVTTTYSDEEGELKTKTKKLGKIQALINYRNGLAHGFNQSKEKASNEFEMYYPLLLDILEEARFLSRYTLWHVESGQEGIQGLRLMGANPSRTKINFEHKGVNPAISPLFMINDATGDILPLYTFFDVDKAVEYTLPDLGKDVFVFEGNTKNTVIYISSSGEHLEKTTRFQHWKDLLAQKDMEVKWIDDKKLTVKDLLSVSAHVSTIGIQTLISSGKYLREATVEREDLNMLLKNFESSSYSGFVLGGESGIGKSTLLAHKTEQWQEEGHPVVFYRASSLVDGNIAQKLLRDCALKINYLEDFLSIADPIFKSSEKKFYLVIDALNEYPGKTEELIKSIESIISQAKNYPWFKVIASIRDSVYNRLKNKFGEITYDQFFFIEEEKNGETQKSIIIRLQPLGTSFVSGLFNSYKNYKRKEDWSDKDGIFVSRPLNDFEELDPNGSTIQLLRSPLMARLIMTSFHRAKLPSTLKSEEVMRLYLENIIQEKTNDSPGFPERIRFLKLLVAELDKANSERIDRDNLAKTDYFRPHLFNSQKDSPYVQLLDLGVLLEEWENDHCYMRFAFDKLLEYLLAEHHWPKTAGSDDLKLLCERLPDFKILQGAVEQLLYRFCLSEQYTVLTEIIDLSDHEEIMQPYIIHLSESLLLNIAIENHELFDKIIPTFIDSPGETDLIILKNLSDILYTRGYLNQFMSALNIAKEEAVALKDDRSLIELNLSEAQYNLLKGNYIEAEEQLKVTLESSKKINYHNGEIISLRKLGVLAWRQGQNEKSMEYFERGLSLSQKFKIQKLSATFMNNIAVLKKNQGDISAAERLYNESLEIKRELGDKSGIAQSLNNLGILKKAQGDIAEAERLYNESLEIKRELGDKKGIAGSLNNLGSLKKAQGDIAEAERLYNESLEIRRELGYKSGIAESLNSLGILKKDQGDISEAEKLYNESLEIKRELGDKSGIAISYYSMGVIARELDENENAVKHLTKSFTAFRKINNRTAIINVIHTSYTIVSNEQRQHFMAYINEIDREDLMPNEISWLSTIDLISYCIDDVNQSVEILQEKSEKAIEDASNVNTQDIDKLPVEALHLASLKLIELGARDEAIAYSKKALDFIGERKTIIKKTLEKIVQHYTTKPKLH